MQLPRATFLACSSTRKRAIGSECGSSWTTPGMPRPRRRLIPILLLDRRRRLVKTVGFGERTYIGDPFNVVRLFNEKEVDELCLLDIDATVDQRAPDVGFLGELASECFMPLTYGGGITGVEQCRKLSRAGIEKFVVGTASLDDTVMRSIAKELGSQALVACVDVKGSRRCRSLCGALR